MEVALACRSTFMVVFQSISSDFLNLDAKFPLENLFFMKDFLAFKVKEKEAKDEDSSGASPPSSKGAP